MTRINCLTSGFVGLQSELEKHRTDTEPLGVIMTAKWNELNEVRKALFDYSNRAEVPLGRVVIEIQGPPAWSDECRQVILSWSTISPTKGAGGGLLFDLNGLDKKEKRKWRAGLEALDKSDFSGRERGWFACGEKQ